MNRNRKLEINYNISVDWPRQIVSQDLLESISKYPVPLTIIVHMCMPPES